MITAIVIDGCMQAQIRRYETDSPLRARDLFVKDWIDEKIIWDHWEYAGPNCTATVPAFTPEFLCVSGKNEEDFHFEEGVLVHEWMCITGFHGSDEHIITGYFVKSDTTEQNSSGDR
jgi:hypothetical protein